MKVLIADRVLLYKVVSAAFGVLGIEPRAAELGVHDGSNAEVINKFIRPRSFYLVDAWSKDIFIDYSRNNLHRAWVDDFSELSYYFRGPISEQSTFDKLFSEARDRFSQDGRVRFFRGSTRDAFPLVRESLGSDKLDFIYVDASHQYESVLDDLMGCKELLSANGFLQLNDCCHSELGVRQNLGVLEAAVKFCKIAEFIPILVTNTDWSDVVLVKKGSPMIDVIDRIVVENEISFVEVPHQLFGALSVRRGRTVNVSFI